MQVSWGTGAVHDQLEDLVGELTAANCKGAVAIEYFRDFDSDGSSTKALRDHLISLGVRE